MARGFSLVELLVTLALMAIMISAAAPALLSSHRSSALTQAGNTLADMTTLARQTALSKNTITALIVTTKTSPHIRQAVIVTEYDTARETWKPLGGWVRLPDAASVIDMDDHLRAQGNAKARVLAPLNLSIDGRSVQTMSDADYSALVFYPDGRMENGAESTRQLSARFATDSSTAGSDSLANYYDVVVNSHTSAFRIMRP